MKEIKFRAYNPDCGMVNNIQITFAHGIRLLSPNDMSANEISDDKSVLMQYTGLKDKNGTEIYESDVLDFPTKSVHEDGVVIFEDGGFWLKNWEGKHHMPTEDYREVIGNVHENPELLTNPL